MLDLLSLDHWESYWSFMWVKNVIHLMLTRCLALLGHFRKFWFSFQVLRLHIRWFGVKVVSLWCLRLEAFWFPGLWLYLATGWYVCLKNGVHMFIHHLALGLWFWPEVSNFWTSWVGMMFVMANSLNHIEL